MTDQLDVFRDSTAVIAAAYRAAAQTARLNPYEPHDKREQRARHYESEAARIEGAPHDC